MRTARRHDHGQRRRQAAPPAAQAGGAEDRPRPRQHAQQGDPPRLDSSPPPPRPADPAHRQRPPRSTAAPSPSRPATIQPRQQDRHTARHSPTEPGQRTPRPDARRQHPRRPGRPQDAASAALLLCTPISSDSPPGRPTAAHAGQLDRQRTAADTDHAPPTVHELNRNRTPRSPRQKSRKYLKKGIDNQEII